MNDFLRNKKVLIVDDEQTMLEIVKEVIKREGAIPSGVNSIEKALGLLRRERFDAVVLDRYLPDGDGHDVLRKIKGNPETAEIAVVMLTGEKDREEIQESVRLGAVGYIIKPFTPKDFLKQLNKIFGDNKTYI